MFLLLFNKVNIVFHYKTNKHVQLLKKKTISTNICPRLYPIPLVGKSRISSKHRPSLKSHTREVQRYTYLCILHDYRGRDFFLLHQDAIEFEYKIFYLLEFSWGGFVNRGPIWPRAKIRS